MTMTDRGLHPDLLEEQEQPATPAPETPSRRGRTARAAPQPEAALPPADTATEPPAPPEATSEPPTEEQQPSPPTPAEPPEWWVQIKDARDPEAALDLLTRNMSKQDLEKNTVLQGWIGDMGRRRAQAMLQQQETDKLEQQKREALSNGDFYGLGQLTAPELQQRAQHQANVDQGAPFMEGVSRFQQTLPSEVQQSVQGRTFGLGKSYQEGVAEYLGHIVESTLSHRLNEEVEKELKRREPALRKAWLSESNGTQPVPELEGGRAPGVREITDEQLAHMSLAESDAYLDERGQPRPGVRLRLTRAINLREQQR